MVDGSLKSEYERLAQVNALIWARTRQLQLRDGIAFDLAGLPYLVDLVNCDKRVMNIKKGTQVCITTGKYIEAVHACYYRKYDQNIIYMMPTVKAVETLAKVSFDPIFDYNPWLKKVVTTNTTSVKEINGRSIVFVGAQPQSISGGARAENTKDSPSVRSIPADCVKRDEIDLMDSDMVEISKARLNRSRFRIEENYGSPTYPGYGIDLLYDKSDQRKWQIKCSSCGKYTCLPETFPACIILKDGRWIRSCIHCHSEIFVKDGFWRPEYPDREEAGFWVDGLISPMADLKGYMLRYNGIEGSKMCEFMRSIIGVASAEAENQLSITDIIDLCGMEIQNYSSDETFMGVDIGNVMHAVIGIRTGRETYEILNVSRVSNFGELHDLAKKMNVRTAVLDAMPDIHAVREFQTKEPYRVYRCQYSESMTGKPDYNDKTGVLKVNRNEMCDRVHETYKSKKIKVPRNSPEVQEYARQMTMTAKTIIEHPETGIPKPRWIKLGSADDHYFHATLYFLLAAQRSSPKRRGEVVKRFTSTKKSYHI